MDTDGRPLEYSGEVELQRLHLTGLTSNDGEQYPLRDEQNSTWWWKVFWEVRVRGRSVVVGVTNTFGGDLITVTEQCPGGLDTRVPVRGTECQGR